MRESPAETELSGEEDCPKSQYENLLYSLSKKWLLIQLTHDVSAAAANAFWDVALTFFPGLAAAKKNCGAIKKVPGYIHLRRKLYDDICPPINMTFAFLNKNTRNTEEIESKKDPSRQFPRSQYTKLYEEAHIKVN